ncbi:MAG TPA: sialate O-acetylesterase, partial [Opitutaceae bacterium]
MPSRSLVVALLALGASLRADVKLPAIIGSNMVVQVGQEIPVWGWAAPGEAVTVTFADKEAAATTGADGRWQVKLAASPAGGPHTMKVRGRNTLTLTNVLVGEVWLCSGQSNMTFRVDQADDAAKEIAGAAFPSIRLFTVKRTADERGPRSNCEGSWVECSPKTVGTFSAAGYFFGRELHQNLKRPVGLIHSSWGGTKAEAWTPRPTLEADEAFRPILDRWAREMADFPRLKAEFETNREQLTADWKIAAEKAKAAGRMPPSAPRLRTGPNTQYAPCGLYNAMIAPLAPFALRGVIWYQGEANAGAPVLYRQLFPALIGAWRETWQSELPFIYVQLPNLARQPEPSKSGWAELR